MNKKIVFLIEDNPDDIELTKHAFNKSNISEELVVSNSGENALEILFSKESQSDPVPLQHVSLIFLDIKLPGINGIEVLKKIRENPSTRYIPVVILTSSVEEKDIIKCYDNGANSYIRKPIDFVEFIEVFKKTVSYWLNFNETALFTQQEDNNHI